MTPVDAPAERAAVDVAVDAGPVDGAAADACPACGEVSDADAYFCEACGVQLAAPPIVETPLPGRTADIATCPSCSSTSSTDGWCDVCGTRMPVWRDHYREQPSPWVGGACDRGLLHHRNEDALALVSDEEPGSFAALVVCDGVSNSTDGDVASLAAARAARDVLASVPAELSVDGSSSNALRIQRLYQVLVDAGAAAQSAARAVGIDIGSTENPPSSTLAAAVIVGDLLAVGWVGDSRVYWLPDSGPSRQLTVDDSWATEQIKLGVDRAAAETDRRGHAITKWLGIDSPDPSLSCASTNIGSTPGWVVACSDGLWNYVSAADDLRDLVASLDAPMSAAGSDVALAAPPQPDGEQNAADTPDLRAAALVAWANAKGGHDNITAALARVPGHPSAVTSPDTQ